MAIYVFNLLVGYLPNGVDNAQGYRAKMLGRYFNDVNYVFTELPERKYINYYKKIGIDVCKMLSAHQWFTDNHELELKGNVKKKLEELRMVLQYKNIEYGVKEIDLYRDGSRLASILLEEDSEDSFYAVNYYNREKLFRTENYTDGISYVNYFVTAANQEGRLYAKLARRVFFNRNGTVVYEQVFEGEKEWYLFPNGSRYTKQEFIVEFIKSLHLTENDIVIIDRPSPLDFVQPLFQYGNRARFITVFHSGHFFEKNEDTESLYLNSEYYYWFKYSQYIDVMVVSTLAQKEELASKLQEYQCIIPDIKVIPAGGIERIRVRGEKRRPYSLLAVSRLTPQKKIEWIIRSVSKAHGKNPQISLAIYGNGNEKYKCYLQNIVNTNHAQSYIRFMGMQDVTEIYKEYEVFVSASLGETLGLSVMEAIGSGMAVIGLNVKYGNRLFVHPDKNGYLIDMDLKNMDEDLLVEKMAEKIVEIFQNEERLEEFHRYSYEIAKDYLFQVVEDKWKKLLVH